MAGVLRYCDTFPVTFSAVAAAAKKYWIDELNRKVDRLSLFASPTDADADLYQDFFDAFVDQLRVRVNAAATDATRLFICIRERRLLDYLQPFINCGALIMLRKQDINTHVLVPCAGVVLALTERELQFPTDSELETCNFGEESRFWEKWAAQHLPVVAP